MEWFLAVKIPPFLAVSPQSPYMDSNVSSIRNGAGEQMLPDAFRKDGRNSINKIFLSCEMFRFQVSSRLALFSIRLLWNVL